MSVHIVVGGFFGDEGKGKIVGYLALSQNPWGCVRTGATNAGHTVTYRGRTWRLRAIPSGFINHKTKLYIARGALIDLEVFLSEAHALGVGNRVWLDFNTGIITSEHVARERMNSYLMEHIGSTGTGVGSAMSDRVFRRLRLARDYPELRNMVTDTQQEILEAIDQGELVLIEATQGYWLSLYHGTYPYVTSRDTTASAALSEVGLGPRSVDRITVVFKAYVTRVGSGPLPGEISREKAVKLGWAEYGTVTGRPRRAAPFNSELARRAVKANTATDIALTKIDILFPQARCKKRWDDLPREAKLWIGNIEDKLGAPVVLIGTGEDVECTIDLSREKGVEG
ncbi:adenylosuccinate synthetase [Staphylothermus hellenicus]|uniref:Adenylosuccinate synthetase n=1 Tax=Staphylothermus hellenicus (strain DSM 12710 / JCM 10830 / BK20S6-10-b1 / P8) TaxID=591019 RepID=D7DAI6_STAHD|nr:adenylosuccinate synthetase [Staphylothermus hellenicus]ADI31183.1 Adenylosuccinate synthase [Staphylothermus hellenicus DSM 12710]